VHEAGEEAVDLMRTIKHALDPNNIFNPGKVIRW
jgi:D-lactate dehydrogenase (cytochrome)